MREQRFSIARGALAVLTAMLCATAVHAQRREGVLHSFNSSDYVNGYYPEGGVIIDADGDVYGTTLYGGPNVCGGSVYCGTVFELTPKAGGGWTQIILHSFDGRDGDLPSAGVIFDASGNLYGTTASGGAYGNYGTVFELTPSAGGGWTEEVLHSFNNDGSDGYGPQTPLIFDSAGNLYGTTYQGGAYDCGTVFELIANGDGSWTETVLLSFGSNDDGSFPTSGVIVDTVGNLYGETGLGGTYRAGTVFGLRPKTGGGWEEGVLHSFNDNGKDGYEPSGGLAFDTSGNLYGTTGYGGADDVGTVFELGRKAGGGWREGPLHSFKNNGKDGYSPTGGVMFDSEGNLLGATTNGGSYDGGTVFGLAPKMGGGWQEGILHSFRRNGKDGIDPSGGLTVDDAGNLFGTTVLGGIYNDGTVFAVRPQFTVP